MELEEQEQAHQALNVEHLEVQVADQEVVLLRTLKVQEILHLLVHLKEIQEQELVVLEIKKDLAVAVPLEQHHKLYQEHQELVVLEELVLQHLFLVHLLVMLVEEAAVLLLHQELVDLLLKVAVQVELVKQVLILPPQVETILAAVEAAVVVVPQM